MKSPEQTDVEQRVELAHVHSDATVRMTWSSVGDRHVDQPRDGSSAGEWSFFECRSCGSRVAFRFRGGAPDVRWEG